MGSLFRVPLYFFFLPFTKGLKHFYNYLYPGAGKEKLSSFTIRASFSRRSIYLRKEALLFFDNKYHTPLGRTTLQLLDTLQEAGYSRNGGKIKLFACCELSLIPPQLTPAAQCLHNCWKPTWPFLGKSRYCLLRIPFPSFLPIGFRQVKDQSTSGNNALSFYSDLHPLWMALCAIVNVAVYNCCTLSRNYDSLSEK